MKAKVELFIRYDCYYESRDTGTISIYIPNQNTLNLWEKTTRMSHHFVHVKSSMDRLSMLKTDNGVLQKATTVPLELVLDQVKSGSCNSNKLFLIPDL